MIGIRYIDELFAIYRIPREFWRLIQKDLRYDGRIRKIEGFLLLVSLPLISSSVITYYEVTFGNQFYSLLIAAATLFVGFSMNSVLLLLRYSNKEDSSPLLVDQTRNLISYLLYLGVFLAFLGLTGYAATAKTVNPPEWIGVIVTTLSVFVLVHFLIVVLFLPARIFTIIEQTASS